jgi:hypothetical protein
MRYNDFKIIESKLFEGRLTPGELFVPKHLDWRPANFLKKLKDRTPFVDSADGSTANQYIAEPGEYARIKPIVDAAVAARLKDPNASVPSIVINTDKGPMSISKFEKADLQTAKGQVTSKINVQPIGLNIAADKVDKSVSTTDEIKQALEKNQTIKGSDLYSVLAKNEVLKQAGELGSAIVKAATDIHNGMIPVVKDYDPKIQNTMAIDAGEYLGIMQMVHDTADFPKKKEFLKFLETSSLDNMLVIFPGSQNSQLQDSYGVQNTDTGHSIMISSKGGIGSTADGAAPALSGLKIPDDMAKKRKPGNGIDFILLMQSLSTVEQPFVAFNFLKKFYPDTIPNLYDDILPFTTKDIAAIVDNIKGGDPLDKKYQQIISSRKFKARSTEGGKLFYTAAKDLVDTINNAQPIPDFRQTILSVLDMNFVQIFSRVTGGKLTAKILWPGTVDGNVQLWTKAEAAAPSSAAFSFKVTD